MRSTAATPPQFDSLDAAVDFLLARIDGRCMSARRSGWASRTGCSTRCMRGSNAIRRAPPAPVHRAVAGSAGAAARAGSALPRAVRRAPFRRRLPAPGLRAGDEARRAAGAIEVEEFYLQSGALLGSTQAQRRYASLNYTHVATRAGRSRHERDRAESRARGRWHAPVAVVQHRPHLRCARCDRRRGLPRPLLVAEVDPELPWLGGGAVVDADFFDIVVTPPGPYPTLFGLPRQPVSRRRLRDRLPRQHAGARRRHAADRHRRAGRCAVPRAGAAPHRQRRLPAGAAGAGSAAGAPARGATTRRPRPVRAAACTAAAR